MHGPVLDLGVEFAVGETGSGSRRHRERAELRLELFGVEARARSGEVQWGELEVPVPGPVRQDAQHVAQVGLGLEAVQLARGDEAEEGGGRLC